MLWLCYYAGVMKRTTVMLPPELKDRAVRKAREEDISLGALIRRGLREVLDEDEDTVDPLFADRAVYDGPSPSDTAAEHDRHLYGDP